MSERQTIELLTEIRNLLRDIRDRLPPAEASPAPIPRLRPPAGAVSVGHRRGKLLVRN